MDQNTLERWEKIKAFRNCPKILEDLQEIKYNKSNEWEVLVNLLKIIMILSMRRLKRHITKVEVRARRSRMC